MRRFLQVAGLAALAMLTVGAGAAVGPVATAGADGPVATDSDAGPIAAAGADSGPMSIHEEPGDWCPNDRAAPESDRLGWEQGCWWDAELDIDRSDGLNDSELRAVVGRSMARIERVRELEFQRTVPVDVISREQHREDFAEQFNVSADERLRENVVLEAALLVGEDEGAVAAQRQLFGSATLGYYDTEEERIVIVSENTSTPKLNEITLSQELFHALQDQRWNISHYDQGTWEDGNAINGIVEGDGNYVDYLYQQRCEAEWDCLERQNRPSGGDFHAGIYILFFQPYSDGPAFVEHMYEADGWDGVNAVYENPPASSAQVIDPERYPETDPVNVTVPDTAGEEWRVPEAGPRSHTYGKLGEAGLFTMFLYPAIDSQGAVRSDMAQNFYNVDPTEIADALDPYNYTFAGSDGWAGDKLRPYVRADSTESNETAYVWRLAWESESEATEFREEYWRLLEYYGAKPVEGHVDTFRIPDEESFGDAVYVTQEGEHVTIVNAPTVEELPTVAEGAAPEGTQDLSGTIWESGDEGADGAGGADDSDGSGDGGDGAGDGESEGTDTDEDDTTGTVGPGLGVGAALGALVVIVALALRRRR